jgi:hypothetical protein
MAERLGCKMVINLTTKRENIMKIISDSKKMQAVLCIILVSLIISLLFSSCHLLQQTNSNNTLLENKNNNYDFERSRRLWFEKGITNYNMVVRIVQEGVRSPASPVLIEVRNGKAISIKPISKSDQREIDDYNRFDTIEKMFDEIQAESKKEETTIRVLYNEEFGYPIHININYRKGGWKGIYIDEVKIM